MLKKSNDLTGLDVVFKKKQKFFRLRGATSPMSNFQHLSRYHRTPIKKVVRGKPTTAEKSTVLKRGHWSNRRSARDRSC